MKFQSVRSFFPTAWAAWNCLRRAWLARQCPPNKNAAELRNSSSGAVRSRDRPPTPLKSVEKTAMVPSA